METSEDLKVYHGELIICVVVCGFDHTADGWLKLAATSAFSSWFLLLFISILLMDLFIVSCFLVLFFSRISLRPLRQLINQIINVFDVILQSDLKRLLFIIAAHLIKFFEFFIFSTVLFSLNVFVIFWFELETGCLSWFWQKVIVTAAFAFFIFLVDVGNLDLWLMLGCTVWWCCFSLLRWYGIHVFLLHAYLSISAFNCSSSHSLSSFIFTFLFLHRFLRFLLLLLHLIHRQLYSGQIRFNGKLHTLQ